MVFSVAFQKAPKKAPSKRFFRIVYTGNERKKLYLLSAFPCCLWIASLNVYFFTLNLNAECSLETSIRDFLLVSSIACNTIFIFKYLHYWWIVFLPNNNKQYFKPGSYNCFIMLKIITHLCKRKYIFKCLCHLKCQMSTERKKAGGLLLFLWRPTVYHSFFDM